MATFPALTPSTRTYSPGAFPHTAHGVYDGSQVRVRHSNTVLGVRLRLFFPAITTAELVTVIEHYSGQRGRFLPFAIPDELLSGVDTPADFTPAGHQWRYAARPTVEDISIVGGTNRHNLTIELETVPPENTIVPGARLRARASLQAGSALLGAFFDVYAWLDAGPATGGQSMLLNVSTSLFAGPASNVPPFVDPFTAVATLSAGTTSIDVAAITYTQSSVWPGNAAATNAGMTNGVFAETLQTGTDGGPAPWVQMDLGAVFSVATIYVGCDFSNTLAGGWGKFYTENRSLYYSTDGSSWTFVANTGTFSTGIKTFSVSFNARYIKISVPGNDYLAITEFYATST